jgi:demethylmenaquinone methyltransferase/2-methoxy-6-polyprenyl-1,4-benzoquinol methylase
VAQTVRGAILFSVIVQSAKADSPASIPRNAGGKSGAEVREMFSRVAQRYDFLNHFLSLGLDIHWRNVCAREVRGLGAGDTLADLCTGTGDLALTLKKNAPQAAVIALDFTPQMAAFGPPKAARKKFDRVTFGIGDSLSLPLRDNSVAAASVAFGIRNVANLERGLSEMARVVRPGGKLLVLEFTKPPGRVFGPLYMFYFRHVLPFFGRLIAATAGDAYRYLPQSVQAFAGPDEMTSRLRALDLVDVRAVSMTFGVVHLYVGVKKGARA